MSKVMYNNKISYKANESLRKRAETLKTEKRLAVLISIIVISLIVILCTSIKTFASSEYEEGELHTYYTSVRVEQGDTIWSIADDYMLYSDLTKQEYVDHICELNHTRLGDIEAGQYIIVEYYSYE